MKILNLTEDSGIYTSNAYLVTGSWNTLEDVNTLIDVGRDPAIIEKINNASTGVGKHKVDQVLLTHGHYDHAGMVEEIKREFNARIFAYSPSIPEVDKVLKDGEMIKAGDDFFEVIYTPGHSNDSICLYNAKEKLLFAGDSPLIINTVDCNYEEGFIRVLERLVAMKIDVIYFGHGKPYMGNCNKMLRRSLENVEAKKNNFNVGGRKI